MHGIFAEYCWQSDNAKSMAIGVPICCSCGWSLLQNKIEKSVLFEQENVQIFQVKFSRDFLSLRGSLNPIVPNAPFLYPLKTSENFKVFFCFQGVEKWFWKLYNENICQDIRFWSSSRTKTCNYDWKHPHISHDWNFYKRLFQKQSPGGVL